MKKLLTLLLLGMLCLTSKAQSLTFEETVKYINDQITCCSGNTRFMEMYSDGIIYAKKDGTLSWYNKKTEKSSYLDFTDLKKDGENDASSHNGIKKWYNGRAGIEGYYIGFTSADGKMSFKTDFATATIQERVFKAFVYLQSLCKPTKKDPFAN